MRARRRPASERARRNGASGVAVRPSSGVAARATAAGVGARLPAAEATSLAIAPLTKGVWSLHGNSGGSSGGPKRWCGGYQCMRDEASDSYSADLAGWARAMSRSPGRGRGAERV